MAEPPRVPPAHCPVLVGLEKTETVLRGGFLEEPVLLSRLRVVDGRQFVYLHKSCSELSKFLTGHPAWKRHLKGTTVFEDIQKVRDEKYKAVLKELMSAQATPEVAAEAPAEDDLGLDDEAEADAPARGKREAEAVHRQRRLRKLARTQLPRMASVVWERPGRPPWSFTVLLENARGACAIEATSANFATMWEIACEDLNTGVPARKAYGSQRSEDEGVRRAPKHYDDGRREYWVNGRWVSKAKVKTETGQTVVRTLKRRATGEASPPRLAKAIKAKAKAASVDALVLPREEFESPGLGLEL